MNCPVKPKYSKHKYSIFRILSAWFSSSWFHCVSERMEKGKLGEFTLVGGKKVFTVNQIDLVDMMLSQCSDNFLKGKLSCKALGFLLGDSILNTNGDIWKKQREMIRPVFETTKIDATFSIMLSSVNEFISMLETSNATGKQTIFSLDLDEKLTYLTADIIFRTIMSKKLDNKQFIEIYTAFQKFQSLAASLILSQYLGVHTIFQKIFITRRLKNEAHKIRQHIESAIIDKQNNIVNDKDLLSTMMSIKDQDGQNFSLEELVNHITMFFLAGHETSASALTWTFYLLAIYPDI